jgi:hypothetical protein
MHLRKRDWFPLRFTVVVGYAAIIIIEKSPFVKTEAEIITIVTQQLQSIFID